MAAGFQEIEETVRANAYFRCLGPDFGLDARNGSQGDVFEEHRSDGDLCVWYKCIRELGMGSERGRGDGLVKIGVEINDEVQEKPPGKDIWCTPKGVHDYA